MTSPRAFWVLLGAATALGIAVMLFSAVNTVISPGAAADAPWQSRAVAAAWLAAVVLALLAGLNLAWRRNRRR